MLSSNLVKTLQLAALLAVSAAAFGADEPNLLSTMSGELQRNFTALKQKAEPAPYFLSYEVTDQESHSVSASLGELNDTSSRHNRYLDVTVRVGNPKLDNYRRVRGERIQFTDGSQVAIDGNPSALKEDIWLETDRVYRSAADRLIRIKTNQQVKAADRDQSDDFSKEESYRNTETPAVVKFDNGRVEPEGADVFQSISEVPRFAVLRRGGLGRIRQPLLRQH